MTEEKIPAPRRDRGSSDVPIFFSDLWKISAALQAKLIHEAQIRDRSILRASRDSSIPILDFIRGITYRIFLFLSLSLSSSLYH